MSKAWIASLIFILVVLLLGYVGSILYIKFGDRVHVTEAFVRIKVLTDEIESQLVNGERPLTIDFSEVKKHPYYSSHSLDGNGSVIVHLSLHNVVLIMTPVVRKEKIEWICSGKPENYVPSECRKNL